MLKQSSSKMKTVLAILLAILSVVSLTAVAASAANEIKDLSSIQPDIGANSFYGLGDSPCNYVWYACGTPYGCPYCIDYPLNPYHAPDF